MFGVELIGYTGKIGEAARRESRCMAGRGSRSGICIVRDWGVLACKGRGGVRMISSSVMANARAGENG